MLTILRRAMFFFLCITVLSCSKEDDTDVIDIDPFESYRYDLWKKMLDDNIHVDYLGTQVDTYDYPDYLDESFDVEHQGVGSIETEGVIVSLRNVLLTVDEPDVVLLGIGINDLLADNAPANIIKNVNIIINMLKRHNPNVTILVEQVPGLKSDLMSADLTERLLSYNRMITRLCEFKSNATSKVISIDMYTDFQDAYFADQVHYNAEGADFISQQYYDAIVEHCDVEDNFKILPIGDSRVVGYRE